MPGILARMRDPVLTAALVAEGRPRRVEKRLRSRSVFIPQGDRGRSPMIASVVPKSSAR